MKCFRHPEVDATGVCTSCSRGLCTACAVDMQRGLACRDRCEHEVQRLLDLRDFSYTQPQNQEALTTLLSGGRIRGIFIYLVLTVVFLSLWYLYSRPVLGVMAGVMILFAILDVFARGRLPLPRMDQFRLCKRCGYNITGNTSGKCPECGYVL